MYCRKLAQLGDAGVELERFCAFVNKAVGMPLGAKVALASLHVLHAIVEQDLALPRYEEHDLAVGFVLVVADGCALFECAAHNAGRPVEVHLGLVFLFTALEIGEDGRIHSFQINNHCDLVAPKIVFVVGHGPHPRPGKYKKICFFSHDHKNLHGQITLFRQKTFGKVYVQAECTELTNALLTLSLLVQRNTLLRYSHCKNQKSAHHTFILSEILQLD